MADTPKVSGVLASSWVGTSWTDGPMVRSPQEHFDKESLVGKKLSVSWRDVGLKAQWTFLVRFCLFPRDEHILQNWYYPIIDPDFWINVSSALWSTPYTMMCQEHSSSDVTLCHSHFPKLCSSYSSPKHSRGKNDATDHHFGTHQIWGNSGWWWNQ